MTSVLPRWSLAWRLALGLCAVAGLGVSASAEQGRHALIIGIGQYSAASQTAPLNGVSRDMVNARRMAREMGIPDHAITMLRDSQATKENIQREFRHLNEKVRPGDRVFIYHSGHGTRYAHANSCRQGLQTYTPGRFTQDDILTEEEIAAYTRPISEKADKVVMMIDACFSGGVIRGAARSVQAQVTLRPKFSGVNVSGCDNVGVNQGATRSLLSELRRLGVHEENFVQIAAARDDEVSWDSDELGGLATHVMAQCLTGGAADLNGSGAISLDEVRACAQARLDALMKPHAAAGLLPSSIQVRGNRNLIPVALPKPPTLQTTTATTTALAPAPPQAQAVSQPALQAPLPVASDIRPAEPSAPATLAATMPADPVPSVPAAPPSVWRELASTGAAAQTAPMAPAAPVTTSAPSAPAEPPAALASLATLKDIEQQRDPRLQVQVRLAKPALKIGKDALDLTVRSNQDGYVYLVLLGSDAKSFYVLFPNGLDNANRIKAGQTLQLPRPDWQIKAAGPSGTNHLLVMVSKTPRHLDPGAMAPPHAEQPFTYALNDLKGRAALIDFLTGSGTGGRSQSFGARLVEVRELP